MEDSAVKLALDLNRKLPPQQIPKNVTALTQIVEDEDQQDELTQRIDQPLERINDSKNGNDFLK
jgi:ABC-type hemin transport system substrate-binding protein